MIDLADSHIDLVPIFLSGRPELLRRLAAGLERAFALPVEVHPPWFDPETAYDPSRGQYHSTRLLAQLLTGPRPGAARVIGVTAVDLFIPVLTFVFGEAQLGGRAAVVSTHRLRPEAYGLPADDELVAARAEKEALHELGHTYGLRHCHAPDCVMRASTYAEEIDLKPAALCDRCLDVVRGAPTAWTATARPGPRSDSGSPALAIASTSPGSHSSCPSRDGRRPGAGADPQPRTLPLGGGPGDAADPQRSSPQNVSPGRARRRRLAEASYQPPSKASPRRTFHSVTASAERLHHALPRRPTLPRLSGARSAAGCRRLVGRRSRRA